MKNYNTNVATLKLEFSNKLTWSIDVQDGAPEHVIEGLIVFMQTLGYPDERIYYALQAMALELKESGKEEVNE